MVKTPQEKMKSSNKYLRAPFPYFGGKSMIADRVWQLLGGGKRETARVSNGMDSGRFCVIGNAVSVPVAEWIGKRIMMFGDK